MESIFLPSILWLAALGGLFGVILAWASRRFAVEEDPRVDRVLEMLPGANCGGCGYPSCREFAQAIVEGKTTPGACVASNSEMVLKISRLVGLKVEEQRTPMVAVVHCQGGKKQTTELFDYEGIEDCRAAVLLFEGSKGCVYGCLGLGSCVNACPFGAISMGSNGLPVVDDNLCTGCGICVTVCPKGIIELIPKEQKIYLACSSHDRGRKVKDVCTVGCVGCGICAKVTPEDGIQMRDNLPEIDYQKNPNLVLAVHKCPQHCFVDKVKVRAKVAIGTDCNGCGQCKQLCPMGAIDGEPGERHTVIREKCVGCGICVLACPQKAIFTMGAVGYVKD
ncbi:MAG: hypothetical protein DRQ02_05375 [Candidatus Latescibacterota bacterium]|nr:MAG: hypothetical protein DRQ02_05375 [Candidatus Latescibacterota bacterium]RKY71565.1 MAG: hypothetical protein DRQ24_07095 [Candidatus Latescibacterota bacterium]